MDKVSVAVIGVGSMGANHAHAIANHPALDLDIVVDMDADRATQVADRYGATRTLDDHCGALRTTDAVVIATPEQAHAQLAHDVLDSGAHLLLEKPVTQPDALAEARALAKRTSSSDFVTAVSFILRYEPAYASARAAAQRGELGRIVAARAMRGIPTSNSRTAGDHSHPLFYMNIHDIDALMWCIDSDVREVTGVERREALADVGIPDAIQVLLRFDDDTVATLEGYGVLPEDVPGGIDAEFRLVGTNGTCSIDVPGDELVVHGDSYDRPDTRYWPVVNDRMDGAVRRQIDRFAAAIVGEAEVLATVDDGVRAQTVAEAVRTSLAEDRTVGLNDNQ
jgi:predicted dehydrogenase